MSLFRRVSSARPGRKPQRRSFLPGAELIENRVLLPGLSTLSRLVTETRRIQLEELNEEIAEAAPVHMRRELPGTLALVGGSEWTEGCTFDTTLLADSGGTDVVVLPTAAAYQHPERVVFRAAEWFEPLGAQVQGLMVVDRPSAEDAGMAARVAGARFIYLAGGSPLHLRAVLKKSAVFDAIRAAYAAGAVIAGAGAGAMVLTDPMVDPRGGALTLGLGLADNLTVVPHFGDEHDDAHGQKLERTVAMAPGALPVVALPARTALIRAGDGAWRSEGAGTPVVFVGGVPTEGLSALKG